MDDATHFQHLKSRNIEICLRAAQRKISYSKLTKLEKWLEGDQELYVPKSLEDMEKHFTLDEAS